MTGTLTRDDGGGPLFERDVFSIDVTPGWFETMALPFHLGRAYAWSDESRQVLVVNQAAARLFFGDRNPIGSRLSGREIIGVVGDAVYLSAREGAPPTAYFLSKAGYGTLIVRSALGGPERLTGRIIDAIVRADPDVLVHATPLAAFARVTVAAERATAMLAAFFGVVALVLAAVGTYGVMAYAVSRRRTEFAVRRALGATGADVTLLMFGRSVRTAAFGVLLGATVSIWVNRLLEPLLFGVEPGDLTIFAGTSVLLVSVAIAATLWPARRAARLNPAILLRDC
jgi:hypothetical protein